jgi:uncharacterized protein (DUF1778 family)
MEKANRVSPRRDATINLRLPIKVRHLIDTAAAVLGKTRTEFVIESAKQHAIDVLLDQRLFELEDDQWEAFNRALDEPPLPNDQLKQLMARKPPWEK